MQIEWTKALLAKTIDHSVYKPTATAEQIRELCAEARANHFASVCVNLRWIHLVVKELSGSNVAACAAIGFPLGATPSVIKAEEAKAAVKTGAQEVAMVIDLGSLKGGDYKAVEEDIRTVVKVSGKASIKVIIETCYLNGEEKRIACEAAFKAGAHFIDTSTGFGSAGATVDDVRFIRKIMGQTIKIKASGGIRSFHDAMMMLNAGADRIGTFSGVAIAAELPE